MKNKLLIIGKTPPPTGGVTIHVKRVLDFLEINNYNFIFIKLSYLNLFKILLSFVRIKHVHLQTSNLYLQFILVLFSIVFKNNIILFLHGEISNHGIFCTNAYDRVFDKNYDEIYGIEW